MGSAALQGVFMVLRRESGPSSGLLENTLGFVIHFTCFLCRYIPNTHGIDRKTKTASREVKIILELPRQQRCFLVPILAHVNSNSNQ